MCASPCGFVRGVCAWRPAVSAVLSRRFARRASGLTALSRLFASVHACLFSFVRKKETACGILRSCSAGSRSPFARFRGVGAVICLGGFISGLCVSLWRSRRVTGTRGRSYEGGRGRRRGLCASLRNRIGLVSLSAGRTLGLRAPDCAKESSTPWTLFTLRRGCVGAGSPRRHPGTIGDLTGSNLWPGRSCGRSNIAVRTIA